MDDKRLVMHMIRNYKYIVKSLEKTIKFYKINEKN